MRTKKTVTSIYLDVDIIKQLKKLANELNNETTNSLIRRFIIEGLTRQNEVLQKEKSVR